MKTVNRLTWTIYPAKGKQKVHICGMDYICMCVHMHVHISIYLYYIYLYLYIYIYIYTLHRCSAPNMLPRSITLSPSSVGIVLPDEIPTQLRSPRLLSSPPHLRSETLPFSSTSEEDTAAAGVSLSPLQILADAELSKFYETNFFCFVFICYSFVHNRNQKFKTQHPPQYILKRW